GGGKEQITIGHVLCHRAGIPNIPRGAMDLELLERPAEIIRLLAETPLLTRPGRRLAYHAVTGGFVLGEVVRRATGEDIRTVLTKEIREPLGLRWLSYSVAPQRGRPADAPPVTPRPSLRRSPPPHSSSTERSARRRRA